MKPDHLNIRKNINPKMTAVKPNLFSRIKIFLIVLFLLAGMNGFAQIHRVGGGLTFSSGVDYNYGETGNPGFVLKTWLALNKASTFHIVPSVTAYNRYKLETGMYVLTNLMFQGDLDLQYTIFQEGTVKVVAFGGGNASYLNSNFEPVIVTGNELVTDESDFAFGGNLGAGLELRMAPNWDFNISGKYLFSSYSQFIISVQGVYFFKSRRRPYSR
jgi:hypothetical protein